MKNRILLICILAVTGFLACNKNTVSKIPNINLKTCPQQIKVNADTMYIDFDITDGDADLGDDTVSGVFWKDSRYDSAGFTRADFPAIDRGAEDPNKGLQADCIFVPVPQPTPRLDSIHVTQGDTLTYEIYVVDRAKHQSNHIITPKIVLTL